MYVSNEGSNIITESDSGILVYGSVVTVEGFNNAILLSGSLLTTSFSFLFLYLLLFFLLLLLLLLFLFFLLLLLFLLFLLLLTTVMMALSTSRWCKTGASMVSQSRANTSPSWSLSSAILISLLRHITPSLPPPLPIPLIPHRPTNEQRGTHMYNSNAKYSNTMMHDIFSTLET